MKTITITDFSKSSWIEITGKLKETPMTITKNNKAVGVLVSPEMYEVLLNSNILENIRAGNYK